MLYTYVREVDEDQLPAGLDYMVCRDGEHLCVFLRRDRINARMLERAWDAARECSQNEGLVAPIRPRDEVTGIPVPLGQDQPRPRLSVVRSA